MRELFSEAGLSGAEKVAAARAIIMGMASGEIGKESIWLMRKALEVLEEEVGAVEPEDLDEAARAVAEFLRELCRELKSRSEAVERLAESGRVSRDGAAKLKREAEAICTAAEKLSKAV